MYIYPVEHYHMIHTYYNVYTSSIISSNTTAAAVAVLSFAHFVFSFSVFAEQSLNTDNHMKYV